jgi:hypothetical protein
MKRLIGLILIAGSLVGCATHQQANTAVGAGIGAVVGQSVAGREGAAVGAAVGAVIGSNQPVQSGPVYNPPIYSPMPPMQPPRKICHSTIYRDQFGNMVRRTTCQ